MATLTLFKKSVLRFALLLPFCLCVGELAAQPGVVKFKIMTLGGVTQIRIVGQGMNPQPSNDSARPQRVCNGGPGTDCETQITYRWLNADTSRNLKIQYKHGVYWGTEGLQTVNPDLCFDELQNGALTLEGNGAGHTKALTLMPSDAACSEEKVFFFYDVICEEVTEDACNDIEDLDPGTLLDNGGHGLLEEKDG